MRRSASSRFRGAMHRWRRAVVIDQPPSSFVSVIVEDTTAERGTARALVDAVHRDFAVLGTAISGHDRILALRASARPSPASISPCPVAAEQPPALASLLRSTGDSVILKLLGSEVIISGRPREREPVDSATSLARRGCLAALDGRLFTAARGPARQSRDDRPQRGRAPTA